MLQPKEKQRFAASIRIYIQHKRVLEQHSSHYKKPDVAKSMSKCYDLMRMVSRDCREFSLQSLAKMVIMNEAHLLAILPNMENATYARQKEKIEQLIITAKNYAK
ncbi:MAG: hypothetical protein L6Q66_14300 [Bacteroidia bacterium]|nr:hypothetical protein [Bacteroidia bacterium]